MRRVLLRNGRARDDVTRSQEEEDRTHAIYNAKLARRSGIAADGLPTSESTVAALAKACFAVRCAQPVESMMSIGKRGMKHLAALDDVVVTCAITARDTRLFSRRRSRHGKQPVGKR